MTVVDRNDDSILKKKRRVLRDEYLIKKLHQNKWNSEYTVFPNCLKQNSSTRILEWKMQVSIYARDGCTKFIYIYILQRSCSPVREAFSYGIWHISI